ncbi:MAG: ABC transporter substrate-binding protein [Burkholderiales bacterium]
MRLSLISEGWLTWPLYVAQEKGLFEKVGIAVEMTLTGSSVVQLEKLTRGDADIGFQQSDHVVRAVEKGSDLFIFMAHGHAPDLSLVAVPQLKTIAALKGKVIAVDGARTGYALLLRKLLADHGINEGDCIFKEIGGSHERCEALAAGAASASLLNAPFDSRLMAAGFNNLGAINQLFPAYPGAVAAARRSWARGNAAELVAFIRAYNAAYAWLQHPDNESEAIRLLPARLGIGAAAAARAFERFAVRPLPRISAAGLRQVIDLVWQAEGWQPPAAEPGKYLDFTYLQKALG